MVPQRRRGHAVAVHRRQQHAGVLKVDQLELVVVAAAHDVARLDVAVQNAVRVQRRQRVEQARQLVERHADHEHVQHVAALANEYEAAVRVADRDEARDAARRGGKRHRQHRRLVQNAFSTAMRNVKDRLEAVLVVDEQLASALCVDDE